MLCTGHREVHRQWDVKSGLPVLLRAVYASSLSRLSVQKLEQASLLPAQVPSLQSLEEVAGGEFHPLSCAALPFSLGLYLLLSDDTGRFPLNLISSCILTHCRLHF